ncbi:MAG: type II secretion system minor pseudopilin GspK [Candidatus Binataceae bacterium]|nr:type II secretion system minor pseudopilin GspK [Candidatus Binataceae bacterium]
MVIRIRKSEPGVALLATLMAIALMTILVVDFTNSSALGYRSAANQANEIRAEYLARSGVNVGLSLLAQQARINAATQTPFYALVQPWAMPYPPVAIDGGTAEVYIVDEARKFNINQLVNPQTGAPNPDAAMVVGRLCEILGIDPRIIPAIIDWLDPDSVDSPGGGAEADYYLRLNPPYEPRNGPMPTIGDLRMIRGIDTPTFMQLRQFLTVAPELRVNANTVAPELLAALAPQMASNPRLIKEIMIARMRQPFQNVTDISNLPGVGENSGQLMRLLNTTSNYFTINAVGTYAGARKFIFATFRCNPNGTAVLTSWNEQ